MMDFLYTTGGSGTGSGGVLLGLLNAKQAIEKDDQSTCNEPGKMMMG